MDADTRAEGEVLTGRYVLEQRLGAGGAGVVWQAHDRVLERSVAIKLLHAELAHEPETAARFRSEASSAAKLTHPNAVIVYDIGRDGDRDFLVMELVDGPALADLLDRGPLPAGVVAHLGAAIASALGLAHHRGMLHRDVKPANVLLTPDGVPKMADFGIARALGEATARLTAPGSVMGTARYLAPEQLRDGPLDGRVDVYALGLVLYEALTGRPPWGRGTAVEIASRRLSGDLDGPRRVRSDLPPGLDAVVRRATRLEPDERYEDGAALAAALAPFGHSEAGRELGRLARASMPLVSRNDGSAGRPAAAAGSTRVLGTHPATSPPQAPRPSPAPSNPPTPPPPPAGLPPTGQLSSVPRPAAGPPRRRRRHGRIRRALLLLLVLFVATVGVLGMTDTPIPGYDELTETIQNSEVGDLVREVRAGLQERMSR